MLSSFGYLHAYVAMKVHQMLILLTLLGLIRFVPLIPDDQVPVVEFIDAHKSRQYTVHFSHCNITNIW